MAHQDDSDNPDDSDEKFEQRLPRVLAGQSAPLAANHGRRVLFRCQRCQRVWYQNGDQVELALTPERKAELCQELHADLTNLPRATCRSCGEVTGTGEYNIDEYARGKAWGFSWEGVEPVGAHMIATVMSLELLKMQRRPLHADVVTQPEICRQVLQWLSTIKYPEGYRQATPADSSAVAKDNPPGHQAKGTEGWVWKGIIFYAKCPALGGKILVSLYVALAPEEPFSASELLANWRELARIFLVGRIFGEDVAEAD